MPPATETDREQLPLLPPPPTPGAASTDGMGRAMRLAKDAAGSTALPLGTAAAAADDDDDEGAAPAPAAAAATQRKAAARFASDWMLARNAAWSLP